MSIICSEDLQSIYASMTLSPFPVGRLKAMKPRLSGYWRYDDMMADYAAGIAEAHRVLKSKGVLVFKCQDTVHNHRLQLTHARIWSLAEEQGFRLQDLFILITTNRLPVRAASHGRQVQRHARVHHSYFLVFRKR